VHPLKDAACGAMLCLHGQYSRSCRWPQMTSVS
jgi:hypothetical protein